MLHLSQFILYPICVTSHFFFGVVQENHKILINKIGRPAEIQNVYLQYTSVQPYRCTNTLNLNYVYVTKKPALTGCGIVFFSINFFFYKFSLFDYLLYNGLFQVYFKYFWGCVYHNRTLTPSFMLMKTAGKGYSFDRFILSDSVLHSFFFLSQMLRYLVREKRFFIINCMRWG
jgi:hypothetical protein